MIFLSSDWVCKEIIWAVIYNRNIILVWDKAICPNIWQNCERYESYQYPEIKKALTKKAIIWYSEKSHRDVSIQDILNQAGISKNNGIILSHNSIQWFTVKPGKPLPVNCYLAARTQSNKRLYVARALIDETIQVGQYDGSIASIPYGGKEHIFNSFEILMPPIHGEFFWSKMSISKIPKKSIVAGKDHGGYPVYISRVIYKDDYIIGKVGKHLAEGQICAAFTYKGKELGSWDFEVLCYRE